MSAELANRLRAGIEHFNLTGEIEASALASDVEFRQAPSIIDTAGTFQGLDGMRDALHELQEAFEDLRFEPEQILESATGDLVVFIRVHGRGKGSGMVLNNEIAWLAAVRHARVARITVYEERQVALEAAGLAE
jgi:ketosteroid isomerase-like protein